MAVRLEIQEAYQKRAWLYGGLRTHVQAVLREDAASGIPVAALFEAILKASPHFLLILQQAEVRDENGNAVHIVKNLRGRPNETFPAPARSTPTRSKRGEELFFSSGVVRPVPRDFTEEAIEEGAEPVPFEFEVRSEFAQFTPQAVEHRLVGNSSAVLRPVVDEFEIQLLPKLVPAEIHHIRFGIEYFKKTLFGGLATFAAPSVYQRFFVELHRSKIEIRIDEEFGGSAGQLPDFEGNLVKPLDFALDSLDLLVGLESQLRTSLTSN